MQERGADTKVRTLPYVVALAQPCVTKQGPVRHPLPYTAVSFFQNQSKTILLEGCLSPQRSQGGDP